VELPKSSFEIAVGATGRRKSVAIAGDPTALLSSLNLWLRERHG
jgi:uncharacterized protein YggU (UPF0235/DUF167 family)